MQFIYPLLTWAFLLVLVPLVIHLINLVRQRRVEWAAMEFLLKSYKKHRRWIWLKQFLLLLLRMLVVAAVVAMLAGLVTRDQAAFLSGHSTHHFILLDDSVSMGDRGSAGTAFDSAMQALRNIAEKLAEQPTDHRVTLVRFSSARQTSDSDTSNADMNALVVDSEFSETMESRKRTFEVTELSMRPDAPLEFLERLLANAAEQRKIAYVISDFRSAEWEQSSDLREAIRSLRKRDADVHLIRCVDSQHQNVSIVDVRPESGTLAAGVPLLVNVHVKNFGPGDVQQTSVRISAKSYPSDVFVASDELVPEEQVSTLVIDQIGAGETVVRQAQLKFDRAGQHIVQASLPSDALPADNRRQCLVNVPVAVPVLIVDGSGQAEESYYLESIFSPGRVLTGIQPVSRPVSYLRDVVDADLAQYAAIYLLNVEQLDERSVRALERYVTRGGGLAIFTGPNNDPAFLLELHADGSGLFPLPVQVDRDHLRVAGDDTPDLHVNDHPIFRVLVDEGGKNRPLMNRIRIDHYFPPDPDWQSADHPDVQVLATVRGTDPLVVTKPFGDGVVVAFLTTASPSWNNWALGPSYPVIVLQLHGFLSAGGQSFQSSETGVSIPLPVDTTEFLPELSLRLPSARAEADSGAAGEVVQLDAPETSPDSPVATFSIGQESDVRTDRSGVYVADLQTLDGQSRQRRLVVNVPTTESDLSVSQVSDLAAAFDDLDVQIHDVDEVDYEQGDQEGFSWSLFLAGLLVTMLMSEQLLAYSASYHPKGETA